MSESFRRDFETPEEYRCRIAKDEPLTVETDIGKVLDEQKAPDVVVKPGNYWAKVAYRNGNEDEYIDRMRNRYGGEW